MKQFIKKIFGIDKIEKEKEALQAARDKAVAEAVRAQEEEKRKSIKSITSILEGFSFDTTVSVEVDVNELSDDVFLEELSDRIGIKNFVKIKTLEDVFKYNKFVEIWNKYSLKELEKL